MRSGARLVARIFRSGASFRSRPRSGAASTTCSRLSSRSSEQSRRASPRRSPTGSSPGDSVGPDDAPDRRDDERRVLDGGQVDEYRLVRPHVRATSSARRVLPVPPGPVSVTSRVSGRSSERRHRRELELPADERRRSAGKHRLGARGSWAVRRARGPGGGCAARARAARRTARDRARPAPRARRGRRRARPPVGPSGRARASAGHADARGAGARR